MGFGVSGFGLRRLTNKTYYRVCMFTEFNGLPEFLTGNYRAFGLAWGFLGLKALSGIWVVSWLRAVFYT